MMAASCMLDPVPVLSDTSAAYLLVRARTLPKVVYQCAVFKLVVVKRDVSRTGSLVRRCALTESPGEIPEGLPGGDSTQWSRHQFKGEFIAGHFLWKLTATRQLRRLQHHRLRLLGVGGRARPGSALKSTRPEPAISPVSSSTWTRSPTRSDSGTIPESSSVVSARSSTTLPW